MINGYIYLIHAENSTHYKIGFTSRDPFVRLKELQTGSSVPLTLIHFWKGSLANEHDIHNMLQQFRIQGEWFDLELGTLLEAMTYTRQEILRPKETSDVPLEDSSMEGEYGSIEVLYGTYKGCQGFYSEDVEVNEEVIQLVLHEYIPYTTIRDRVLAKVYLENIGEVYLPLSVIHSSGDIP